MSFSLSNIFFFSLFLNLPTLISSLFSNHMNITLQIIVIFSHILVFYFSGHAFTDNSSFLVSFIDLTSDDKFTPL